LIETIGVVTMGRSDYGIYLPILKRIQAEPNLRLLLYVGGMHLSPEFGSAVRGIEADGFEITERIEMSPASDRPEDIAESMGRGTIGFAQAYTRHRPDLLLVLGDRFEMHSAVVAALPLRIPIAHIRGRNRRCTAPLNHKNEPPAFRIRFSACPASDSNGGRTLAGNSQRRACAGQFKHDQTAYVRAAQRDLWPA